MKTTGAFTRWISDCVTANRTNAFESRTNGMNAASTLENRVRAIDSWVKMQDERKGERSENETLRRDK